MRPRRSGCSRDVACADAEHAGGELSFSGASCAQTVSNIQVPLEKVASHIDSRFRCSREELGACMVAYRMFYCPALSVDGGAPHPVVWTEATTSGRGGRECASPDRKR